MKARMINLGWAMARLEEVEEKPALTICWPSGDDDGAGSVMIYDTDGLLALRDELASFLEDWGIIAQARAEPEEDVGQ